jgi:hypothetical protein
VTVAQSDIRRRRNQQVEPICGAHAVSRDGTDDAPSPVMSGFITERNFDECEEAFPGIAAFYRQLIQKPRTFLELVFAFLHRLEASLGTRSFRAGPGRSDSLGDRTACQEAAEEALSGARLNGCRLFDRPISRRLPD